MGEKKSDKKGEELVEVPKKQVQELYKRYNFMEKFINSVTASKLSNSVKIKMMKDKADGEKEAKEIKGGDNNLHKAWEDVIGKENILIFNKTALVKKIKGQAKKDVLWIYVEIHEGNRCFGKWITPTDINTFDYKKCTYVIMRDRIIVEGKKPKLVYLKDFPCPLIFSTEGIGYRPDDNIVNNKVRTSHALWSAVHDNYVRRVTESDSQTIELLWSVRAACAAAIIAAYFGWLNHGILISEIKGLVANVQALTPILEALPAKIQRIVIEVITAIP